MGSTLSAVEEEFEVIVIAHRHSTFDTHPDKSTVLQAGDGFVVSASLEALSHLSGHAAPTRELRRYQQGELRLQP